MQLLAKTEMLHVLEIGQIAPLASGDGECLMLAIQRGAQLLEVHLLARIELRRHRHDDRMLRPLSYPDGQLLLEHVHGAAVRVGVEETAFPHRTEGYNFLVLSQWMDPARADVCSWRPN